MTIDWADLAAACGLMLVIEGMLPFLSPRSTRSTLATLAALPDAALRGAGAASMVAGLLLLWLLRT